MLPGEVDEVDCYRDADLWLAPSIPIAFLRDWPARGRDSDS